MKYFKVAIITEIEAEDVVEAAKGAVRQITTNVLNFVDVIDDEGVAYVELVNGAEDIRGTIKGLDSLDTYKKNEFKLSE